VNLPVFQQSKNGVLSAINSSKEKKMPLKCGLLLVPYKVKLKFGIFMHSK